MKNPFSDNRIKDIFVAIAGLMGVKGGIDISKEVVDIVKMILMMIFFFMCIGLLFIGGLIFGFNS